jgi:tetratricopeptide (TPR) repeat protein
VARLATRIVDAVPGDVWAALALARAQVTLGDRAAARARFAAIEQAAPATAAAAEAQASRAMLDDAQVEAQLQSVMRAAQSADAGELADVAARARRLAAAHALWPAWVSAAVAERRRGALASARAALAAAIELSPGATAAHLELAVVLVALGHAADALKHAERARELEGDAPRTLRVLAHALDAAGRREEAKAAAARAVALDADDAEGRALLDRLSKLPPRPSWIEKLGGAWRDLTRR